MSQRVQPDEQRPGVTIGEAIEPPEEKKEPERGPENEESKGPEKDEEKLDRGAFIEVAEDEEGGVHWQLWSGNGLRLAQSSEVYKNRASAIKGARAVARAMAQDIPIVKAYPKG